MPEILLVLAVILIFFGAKKLPELAKGMGQGIKEFKKATRDVNNELERAIDETMGLMLERKQTPEQALRMCGKQFEKILSREYTMGR